MVSPPTLVMRAMQSVRLIRDGFGRLITINEAVARIQLLRSSPERSWVNERPSHREVLDYMNDEAEAEDLELQINFVMNILNDNE